MSGEATLAWDPCKQRRSTFHACMEAIRAFIHPLRWQRGAEACVLHTRARAALCRLAHMCVSVCAVAACVARRPRMIPTTSRGCCSKRPTTWTHSSPCTTCTATWVRAACSTACFPPPPAHATAERGLWAGLWWGDVLRAHSTHPDASSPAIPCGPQAWPGQCTEVHQAYMRNCGTDHPTLTTAPPHTTG